MTIRGFRTKRCGMCSLPVDSCICESRPALRSNAKFIILMNEKEINKPTNTGRVIANTLAGTKIITWERLNPSKYILEMISKGNTYLIFPSKDTDMIYNASQGFEDKPNFILIDGTWKQAKKIYRKSTYLHNLPCISIEGKKSNYHLRKKKEEGNLCTAETAIETLRLNSEESIASSLEDYLTLFVSSYMPFKREQVIINE